MLEIDVYSVALPGALLTFGNSYEFKKNSNNKSDLAQMPNCFFQRTKRLNRVLAFLENLNSVSSRVSQKISNLPSHQNLH